MFVQELAAPLDRGLHAPLAFRQSGILAAQEAPLVLQLREDLRGAEDVTPARR